MKYFFVLAVLIITAGCATLGGSVTGDEVYEGSAQGYRGSIDVRVRISGGNITEIIILNSREDRFTGGAAIEELIDAVIENNSTDVDAVSGATVTSKGFLEAVNNAIIGL